MNDLNRFRVCPNPKCGEKIGIRSRRPVSLDGSREELYKVCRHCGCVATYLQKVELLNVDFKIPDESTTTHNESQQIPAN